MTTDLEIRISSRNLADAGINDATRKVRALRNEFRDVETASKIDSKVNVDDSELDAAGRKIDDLDNETIDVEVDVDTADAEPAVQQLEDKFAGIDLSDMGSSIAGQMSSLLSAAGPVAGVVGLAAAAFGDDMAAGLNRGFNANRNRIALEIRTGLSGIDLEPIGEAAGSAYAAGFGESMSDLQNTAALLQTELGGIDDDLDLSEATRQASVMADVLGIDLAQSINLARRLVANELAPDTDTAFNLMVETAQRFQLSFDDIFEVASEFAPVFRKLGVDGAQAFHIIGETVQQGLLPNVDRAAELFEEFNIRVTDNSAEDAIEGIGLSMRKVRDAVAEGLGAEALAGVAEALLDIEDAAQRDEAAIAIFGAAIESAADPEAVLTLLATADAVRDVGDAADEAVAKSEASQTGFQRLGRDVEGFFAAIGRQASKDLGKLYADLDAGSARFGIVEVGAKNVGEAVGGMVRGFGSGQAHVRDLERAMADLGGETLDLTADVDELSDAEAEAARQAEALELGLIRLSDWADQTGEAALRRIWSSVSDLTEEFDENTAAAFSVAEGWDLTTEAGRAGSQTVADLRGDVARLTEQFLGGSLPLNDYEAAMAGVESAIDAAGREAGLTEDEIAALTRSVTDLPASTDVTIRARAERAKTDVDDLLKKLRTLDGRVVDTFVNNNITTNYRTNTYTPVARRSGARAHGGIVGAQDGGVRDGLTLVGEEGPELVDLAPGSQVFSTSDTHRMVGVPGTGTSGAGVTVNLTVQGSVLSERDLIALVRDELITGGLAETLARTA